MSAFTDRLYLTWLGSNGCTQTRRGYGGYRSHVKRREGYPTGQPSPRPGCGRLRPARPMPATDATSRDGSQRANDAASRPDKPDVLASQCALFLPALEKSSTESKA